PSSIASAHASSGSPPKSVSTWTFNSRAQTSSDRPTSVDGWSSSPRSGEVEAIEIHHLFPGRHEVTHECLLAVIGVVDFLDRPVRCIRAEREVYLGAGPLELARGTVATLVHVVS